LEVTGFLVFPIPAQKDAFFDAGAIHVSQQDRLTGPALDRSAATRRNAIYPPRFAVFCPPLYRVGRYFFRIIVDMRIDDPHRGKEFRSSRSSRSCRRMGRISK
jgi:hypothetical protein